MWESDWRSRRRLSAGRASKGLLVVVSCDPEEMERDNSRQRFGSARTSGPISTRLKHSVSSSSVRSSTVLTSTSFQALAFPSAGPIATLVVFHLPCASLRTHFLA